MTDELSKAQFSTASKHTKEKLKLTFGLHPSLPGKGLITSS